MGRDVGVSSTGHDITRGCLGFRTDRVLFVSFHFCLLPRVMSVYKDEISDGFK